MNEAIQNLIEEIKADYRHFHSNTPEGLNETSKKMIKMFEEGLEVNYGKKYIKILKRLGTQTMVWGFIVNVDDDKKFQKGDILMPAGFNAPTRNKARGNIFDQQYTIRWTGPMYL